MSHQDITREQAENAAQIMALVIGKALVNLAFAGETLSQEPPKPQARLLTREQAAEYAGCSPGTIDKARRKGKLRVAGYVGRSPRFSTDDIDEWLKE